jgi:hypothetical protein
MSKRARGNKEGAANVLASLAPEKIRHLDPSIIDKVSWSDFSAFNNDQLIAIGELINQSDADAQPYCYTVPPFVLGPLPQSAAKTNHFSRKFRWQQVDYSNTKGEALPSGAPARILLLHIITTLVRTGEPYVDLKENVAELMRVFGVKPSYGAKGTVNKYESALLSLMRTVIEVKTTREIGGEIQVDEIRFPIFRRDSMHLNERGIVSGIAEVDRDFAQIVTKSSVILDRRTVVELCQKRSPAALDIYIWSTYTNFYLRQNGRPNITLTWDEAYELFSSKSSPKKAFRRDFATKVELVQRVYPSLRLVPDKSGITLWRTETHVNPIAPPSTKKLRSRPSPMPA